VSFELLTGGEAVAHAMRQIDPDVVPAYPITPQTPIIQGFAQFVADGKAHGEIRFYGEDGRLCQVDHAEHGVGVARHRAGLPAQGEAGRPWPLRRPDNRAQQGRRQTRSDRPGSRGSPPPPVASPRPQDETGLDTWASRALVLSCYRPGGGEPFMRAAWGTW